MGSYFVNKSMYTVDN